MTLDLTTYVPLMMLPVVFWMLGNRQIFDNQVEEIVYKSDVQLSGHSIQEAMTHANPLFMTYNTAPIMLFFGQCLYLLYRMICGYAEEEESEDDQLVEGLASY